jgi:hypothetical protein
MIATLYAEEPRATMRGQPRLVAFDHRPVLDDISRIHSHR